MRTGRPKNTFIIDPQNNEFELIEAQLIYFLGTLGAISNITEKPTDIGITEKLEHADAKCQEHQNCEEFKKALFSVINCDPEGTGSLSKIKQFEKGLKESNELNNKEVEKEVKGDEFVLAYLFWILARSALKSELVEDFFRIILIVDEVLKENSLSLTNSEELEFCYWREMIANKCFKAELGFVSEYIEKRTVIKGFGGFVV